MWVYKKSTDQWNCVLSSCTYICSSYEFSLSRFHFQLQLNGDVLVRVCGCTVYFIEIFALVLSIHATYKNTRNKFVHMKRRLTLMLICDTLFAMFSLILSHCNDRTFHCKQSEIKRTPRRRRFQCTSQHTKYCERESI